MNKTAATAVQTKREKSESLFSILKNAFQDRDYRLILIGFAACGFNMSIIESHLFSQFRSYGIAGDTASLTLTVYGIATMIGAAGAGFLFLPKSIPFAFIVTALLGLSGDSTVVLTEKMVMAKNHNFQ